MRESTCAVSRAKVKFRLACLVGALAGISASGHAAAEVFVAPFGGYSFGHSGVDITDNEDEVTSSLKFSESSHVGIMLGKMTKDPGNIYFLYSRQSSDVRSGALSSEVLSDLDISYFHVGGSLYFPNGNFKPYITASLGATHMAPDSQYSTETKFSMGFAGGVSYDISENIALFGEVRGYATFVNSNSSLFCGSTECLWRISGDVMWQGQANAGVSFKF
ncbi:outer membrane beta-barrel protein [Shewanella maritima]|uniref:outer membrane beta-barrel protein n=1 Tax=Shewanella maritima TaxID=2520507 RepID=UPI003735AD32